MVNVLKSRRDVELKLQLYQSNFQVRNQFVLHYSNMITRSILSNNRLPIILQQDKATKKIIGANKHWSGDVIEEIKSGLYV
jgi:hypothetical protein